jgi:hypothetical protein
VAGVDVTTTITTTTMVISPGERIRGRTATITGVISPLTIGADTPIITATTISRVARAVPRATMLHLRIIKIRHFS